MRPDRSGISALLSRERVPRALARHSVASPRSVFAIWAVVCVASIPAVLEVSIETSTESVLDKRSEAWTFYQRSLDLFGGDEIVVLAVENKGAFDRQSLIGIKTLSDAMSGLDGVRRVDSLATQPTIRVDEFGDLHLTPATAGFGTDPNLTEAEVRRRVLSDRVIPKTLVSLDERVLAVSLVLDRDASTHYAGLLSRVDRVMSTTPTVWDRHWVSGVPVFQRETSLQTRNELFSFAPIAVVAIAGLVAFVFRSLTVGTLILVIGGVGNLVMFAAIGATKTAVSFTMVILPPVLLALAAAYAMHALTAASRASCKATNRDEYVALLIVELEDVATPIALSGLTTAIGFAATSLAGIEAVQNVGTFGGIGVLAILSLTLTALPAALSFYRMPLASPRGFSALSGVAARNIARHARTRRRSVVAGWVVASLLACLGLRLIEIDTDATRWFRPGTETRDNYEEIRSRLSGISPINVVIQSRDEQSQTVRSILEPEVLRSVDNLANYLSRLPQVGKAVSIADPIRQMHRGFQNNGSELPPNARAAEQYLLLLESVEQIHDLITPERDATNVIVRLDNNGSKEILETAKIAEDWWLANGTPGTSVRTTGVMFEFARAQDAIARGQIIGLGAALGAIAIVLLAAFRSVRAAGAALIPNIIPLVGIYGAMGFLGVPLDAGTVLVGSLALGIAVDDTVHLASSYYEARDRDTEERSLEIALESVLPAISYTTLIVGLSFGLLGLSDFSFIRNLGLLMAAVMTACLIADIHLLPALLTNAAPSSQGAPH